jgi:hypothetical protein
MTLIEFIAAQARVKAGQLRLHETDLIQRAERWEDEYCILLAAAPETAANALRKVEHYRAMANAHATAAGRIEEAAAQLEALALACDFMDALADAEPNAQVEGSRWPGMAAEAEDGDAADLVSAADLVTVLRKMRVAA